MVPLSLIDRQSRFFELQDRQIDCRGVDFADVALRPSPFGVRLGDNVLVQFVTVFLPFPAALAILDLRKVIMSVVPMTVIVFTGDIAEGLVAVF